MRFNLALLSAAVAVAFLSNLASALSSYQDVNVTNAKELVDGLQQAGLIFSDSNGTTIARLILSPGTYSVRNLSITTPVALSGQPFSQGMPSTVMVRKP